MFMCRNCKYHNSSEYCELENKRQYGFCGNYTPYIQDTLVSAFELENKNNSPKLKDLYFKYIKKDK